MPLRFLHTSDIHLLDLRGVRLWRYLNKRITGRMNLALKRSRKHDGMLFDRMMEQLPALNVDRVVVTGDLTNLSLPSEFEYCRDKLDALPVPVTVIPGNHDTYTPGSARARLFETYLGHHMQGERPADSDYPFVQDFEDVVMIGCSSAVPTPPFIATGLVGTSQLVALDTMLRATSGRVRVVLIHHPPTPGVSKRRHDLVDLDAFGEVIRRHGAELVLHGHEHVCVDTELPGPDAAVPVHGIASGTSLSDKPGRRACFSVYDVSATSIQRERYAWNGTAFELQTPQ